jgi:HD-GYP domain-containing protein (c-di-GMP phosphodiesterase class II)
VTGTLRPARAGTVYRLSEVLSALSYALDITEGQPQGHAVRTCLIGMRLADLVGFPDSERGALFYALLLKDLGCSSNAARLCSLFGADDRALKREHKLTDWSATLPSLGYAIRHVVPEAPAWVRAVRVATLATSERGSGRQLVQTRCDRGADIAAMLGFSDTTREAIRTLDEHWDGRGLPAGLRGEAIPLAGRIVGLAQSVEVFASGYGVDAAVGIALERRGSWFDPALVDGLRALRRDGDFWAAALGPSARRHLAALEPPEEVRLVDDAGLDLIAQAFARVIDAKSPYTFRHSEGVAELAVAIGRAIDLEPEELRDLRRAGLLHDIGKLGVSNLILDKPERLTEPEMAQMRLHPAFTCQILGKVPAFAPIVQPASSHHERLDGRGYHLGLPGERLTAMARALAVADVYEALTADRPYRAGLPADEALSIIRRQSGVGLCPESVEALMFEGGRGSGVRPMSDGLRGLSHTA